MKPRNPGLEKYSEVELEEELASRRAASSVKNVSEMENLLERKQVEASHQTMEWYVQEKSEGEGWSSPGLVDT